MKYTVSILTCTDETIADADKQRDEFHIFTGRTLKEAWAICEKHARRGVKRFGGQLTKEHWGMRGGRFPDAYRCATIRVDY